jgi:hypothetical protein
MQIAWRMIRHRTGAHMSLLMHSLMTAGQMADCHLTPEESETAQELASAIRRHLRAKHDLALIVTVVANICHDAGYPGVDDLDAALAAMEA